MNLERKTRYLNREKVRMLGFRCAANSGQIPAYCGSPDKYPYDLDQSSRLPAAYTWTHLGGCPCAPCARAYARSQANLPYGRRHDHSFGRHDDSRSHVLVHVFDHWMVSILKGDLRCSDEDLSAEGARARHPRDCVFAFDRVVRKATSRHQEELECQYLVDPTWVTRREDKI